MKKIFINDLYSEYVSGDLPRSKFEGLIYRYLVNNQENTCLSNWKRDEYEDYISWFYPRLHKSIDSYEDTGASFEAFISRFLLVSSKEYRGRITSNAITEHSAWNAQVPDMYTMYAKEESPVYFSDNTKGIVSEIITDKTGRKSSRRMLALILKCYYYISDDFAEKIAPKIGLKKRELLDMLKKIRNIRQKKDDKIYFMKENIQTQFLRCLVYEKKLSLLYENETLHNILKLRLERARNRLNKMRKRMAGIRVEATNKQVAEIIGTTKGTVDASLHRLKSKMEEMAKKAELN